MTVMVNMMTRPSFRPITSKIRASGNLATPATMTEMMLVVARRPWKPKLLVTYGSSDADICCCRESVKNTSQMLHQDRISIFMMLSWFRKVIFTRCRSL
jgi:hypothetical protein